MYTFLSPLPFISMSLFSSALDAPSPTHASTVSRTTASAAAGGPSSGLAALLGTPKLLGSSSASALASTQSVKLTPGEIAELREIFNLVDKDGGGSISKQELADLMGTLGIRATPEEIDLMVREVDSDGSGDISFNEFLYVMQRRVNVPYSADEVKAAFRVFENGAPSGYIRVTDLVKALSTYSTEKLSEDKLAEMVAQLEPDGSGMVSYVDFVNMMMT